MQHTLALTKSGEVYSWGVGSHGRLGIRNSGNDEITPKLIISLLNKQVIKIKCGNEHSVIQTFENEIYVWGRNNHGQLGLGDVLDRSEPTKLPIKFHVSSFCCGGEFTLYFDSEGAVYSAGNNNKGECAIKNLRNVLSVTRVYNLPGNVIKIAAGQNHSLALTKDNKIYAWGSCEEGQLGIGRVNIYAWKPQEVILPDDIIREEKIINIVCGFYHSILYTDRNTILSWGYNKNGCLGIGDEKIYDIPTEIKKMDKSKKILQVYASLSLTLIVVKNKDDIEIVNNNFKGLSNEIIKYREKIENKVNRYEKNEKKWDNEICDAWLTLIKSRITYDWVKNGVPYHLRSVFWPKGIGNNLRITPDTYALYLKISERQFLLHEIDEYNLDNSPNNLDKQNSIRLIVTDLNRTLMPLHLFAENEPLHQRTKEVLQAYTCLRADIGYVQGMSYVAAMLSLHIPSNYIVFQCLANMFTSEHFYAFYSLKMELIQEYYDVFNKIFRNHLTYLYKYFEEIGIRSEVFLYNWLQSLFMQCLPVNICAIIMDFFVIRGVNYLIRVSLSILKLLQPKLLNNSYEECVCILTYSKRYRNIWNDYINRNNLFNEVENLELTSSEKNDIAVLIKDVFLFDKNKEKMEQLNRYSDYKISVSEIYDQIDSIC